MGISYKLLNAFTVSSLDATYIVRIDEEIRTGWASDFDPMSDAIMKISRSTGKQRITLVPDPFKEHSCSDKELCVLEGVFPGALAVDIVGRIRRDNVQLWFARDIVSEPFHGFFSREKFWWVWMQEQLDRKEEV